MEKRIEEKLIAKLEKKIEAKLLQRLEKMDDKNTTQPQDTSNSTSSSLAQASSNDTGTVITISTEVKNSSQPAQNLIQNSTSSANEEITIHLTTSNSNSTKSKKGDYVINLVTDKPKDVPIAAASAKK